MDSPDVVLLRWRNRTRTRLVIALIVAGLVTISAGPIIGAVVRVIQAAPTSAGEVALAQAAGGGDIGFANPPLYAAASASAGLFRDVVPPATTMALASFSTGLKSTVLVTLDRDGSLRTDHGYDDVRGLGSPNLNALVAASRA